MNIRSHPILKASILGVSLLVASTALAQPLRVNDIHFIQAAACQGLITSPDLPPMDITAINRFMDIESAGRPALILDQAATARQNARREAATASPEKRADLIAQRDAPSCRRYVAMGAHSSAARLNGEP
jgi:hypothetical protein